MKISTLFGAMIGLCPLVTPAQNSGTPPVNESCTVAPPVSLTNVTCLDFGRIVCEANRGIITILGAGTPMTVTLDEPIAQTVSGLSTSGCYSGTLQEQVQYQ